MTDYNYLEAVKKDLEEVLQQYEYQPKPAEDFDTYIARITSQLEEDSTDITGWEAGSYTCNAAKAREYIFSNMTLCLSALIHFGQEDYYVFDLYNNAETVDCYIRYYVLFNEINIEEIAKKFYKNS